jgi:hypothetical protein
MAASSQVIRAESRFASVGDIVKGDFTVDHGLLTAILGDNFPWYYNESSTSEKFPFLGHTVIRRDDMAENSNVWKWLFPSFVSFCKEHKLEYNRVLRCAINMNIGGADWPHTDPHVDYETPHKVLIAYLNDASGDTIIYRKKYEGGPHTLLLEATPELPAELDRVQPIKNTAVCFDGKNFHASEFPKHNQRRIVCVICFD